MKFLGSLGIDIKLLIAQVINFGLLLWLLTKFLYKPIIKKIEQDEEELERARLQRQKLEEENLPWKQKQELIKAKKRAREIIQEAKNMAKEIKERASKETKKEKEAIIKQIHSHLSEIENVPKIKQQKK